MTALPAPSGTAAAEAAAGPTPCVMLVDDHGLLSASLAALLRTEGYAVAVEEPGPPEHIRARAEEARPTVVLLDLDLGRDDVGATDLIPGLVACGARVVMLSGSSDRMALAACLEAGADAILSKATPFSEVVAAIAAAASGRAVMRPHERDEALTELRDHRRSLRDRHAPFEALTAREADVLGGLMGGLNAETIAERAYVSVATVRTQIRGVLTKLGVSSQLAAVALAAQAGWRPPTAAA